MKKETEKLLRINEAAALLSIHPETLRRWDNDGRLKAVIINARGDRRYRKEDIEKVIRSGV